MKQIDMMIAIIKDNSITTDKETVLINIDRLKKALEKHNIDADEDNVADKCPTCGYAPFKMYLRK